MGDNMLKRTLTMKSKIGFGKFCNLTVAEMFIAEKEMQLIGIYYNLGKIDFTEDILEKLFITEKINKLGKCPEKRQAASYNFVLKKREGRTDLENIVFSMRREKNFRIRAAMRGKNLERGQQFSKSALQYKNQKHT